MKKLKLLGIGLFIFFAGVAHAQISVNVNIGTPPLWGPAGSDNVKYYYLPDVESYYDVPSRMFIYFNGVSWIHRASLPAKYRNYDLYHGYKVVLQDYRGNSPYERFHDHKMKYAKGYHEQPQKTYGERPERESVNERGNSKGDHNNEDRGNKKESKHDNGKRNHGRGNGDHSKL
jgi:hypothetical protein